MNIVSAAADLLWSPVLKKFPGIRIALSEGGTGWIPYFLERIDRTFEMHATWTPLRTSAGACPLEVFREHFLTCFISDPLGVKLRHEIGIDNIAGSATTRTATRCGPAPLRSCPRSWSRTPCRTPRPTR
ncbi:hypothetical protein ACU686_28045 [Yinghuangia aomiensis]